MPLNILLAEWRTLLAGVAPQFLGKVCPGGPDDARWSAVDRCMTVVLELRIRQTPDGGYMVPHLTISQDACLPGDPFEASTLLASKTLTLQQAGQAWVVINNHRIWLDSAPCDYCRSSPDRAACKHCDGTGQRTEPKT